MRGRIGFNKPQKFVSDPVILFFNFFFNLKKKKKNNNQRALTKLESLCYLCETKAVNLRKKKPNAKKWRWIYSDYLVIWPIWPTSSSCSSRSTPSNLALVPLFFFNLYYTILSINCLCIFGLLVSQFSFLGNVANVFFVL